MNHVFQLLDQLGDGNGALSVADIEKAYDTSNHPEVRAVHRPQARDPPPREGGIEQQSRSSRTRVVSISCPKSDGGGGGEGACGDSGGEGSRSWGVDGAIE